VTDEPITYEVVSSAAMVTLNRPGRLNAFLPSMTGAFIECLDRADADDTVHTIVVTGAGSAFCAGADLTAGFDFLGDSPDKVAAAKEFRDPAGIITMRLIGCHKPVIAAINGVAVGMGVSITLAMDVRIAADDARFALPFTRRGMVPEGASSWFLPRAVGMARAQDWICTGRTFDAREALASGLVRELHPAGQVLDAALGVAAGIARNTAPVSVALARRMLWAGWRADREVIAAHRRDSLLTALRGGQADAAEGVAAFLDKRLPRFPQRVGDGVPHVPGWDGLP
jgi:enoyl-CoA hydratase/carnithine racemase